MGAAFGIDTIYKNPRFVGVCCKTVKKCHNGVWDFEFSRLYFAFLAMTSAAHAYIDPGAGSFVLQMMLAGALAVGATVKVFWFRIKQAVRRIFPARQSRRDQPE